MLPQKHSDPRVTPQMCDCTAVTMPSLVRVTLMVCLRHNICPSSVEWNQHQRYGLEEFPVLERGLCLAPELAVFDMYCLSVLPSTLMVSSWRGGGAAKLLQMLSDMLMEKVSILEVPLFHEAVTGCPPDTHVNRPSVLGGRPRSQGYVPKSFQRSDRQSACIRRVAEAGSLLCPSCRLIEGTESQEPRG